jgi:hypothetical protein
MYKWNDLQTLWYMSAYLKLNKLLVKPVVKYEVRCEHGAIRHNMRIEVTEIRTARLLDENTQLR